MHVLYRISSNSYQKERLSFASKEYCLSNFIDNVLSGHDKMTIIADGVDAELLEFILVKKRKNIEILNKNLGSNGACFPLSVGLCFRFATKYCSPVSRGRLHLQRSTLASQYKF